MWASRLLCLALAVLALASSARAVLEFYHTPPANSGAAAAAATVGIRIRSYTGTLIQIGLKTNIGSGITYQVYRSTSPSSGWSKVYDSGLVSSSISGGYTSHSLTYSLTSNYYYIVRARWTSTTRNFYYGDNVVPYTNGPTTYGGISSSTNNAVNRIYGVRIKLRSCTPLPKPANGNVNPGTTTTFSCNMGYTLAGSSSRTCQTSGVWTGSTTSCPKKANYCPSLAAPSNGARSPSPCPRKYQNSCSFSCNAGYSRGGSSSRTCNLNTFSSGVWSGSTTTCNRINSFCPALSAPSNGVLSAGTCSRYVGYSCGSVSCNTGYNRVGPSSRTCQTNARWSSSAWSCALDTTYCPAVPPAPTNGVYTSSCSARSYLASCSRGCNFGYTLSGAVTTTCQASALWSSGTPSCLLTPGYCPSYPVAANATRAPCDGKLGSSCGPTQCALGLTLVGAATRTCTVGSAASGIWSGLEPFCSSTSAADSLTTATAATIVAGTRWAFDVLPRDAGGVPTTAGVDIVDVVLAGTFAGEGTSTANSTWLHPTKYAVTYKPPTLAGDHSVEIWLNSYLMGTYVLTVVPAAVSAPHSDADGEGILSVTEDGGLFLPGHATSFVVTPRDAYGNKVGTAGISLPVGLLRDALGDPWPVSATIADADTFVVSYIVPASGRWTLSLTLDLVPIGASPWLITVAIECHPGTSAFSVTGPCVICPENTYSDQISLRECLPCPEASQAGVGASTVTNCTCVTGMYSPGGVPGVACMPCPLGASCNGGVSNPTARPGFSPVDGSTDSFVQCPNPSACAGNGACSSGYKGRLCAECDLGFYRLGAECRRCKTELTVIMVVLLLVLAFVGCGALVYLNVQLSGSHMYGAAGAMIGLSALQIIALVGSIDVAWSKTARAILDGLSFANFNVDLTSPECSMTLSNPWLFRFILTLCLPVAGALMLALVAALVLLYVVHHQGKAEVGVSGVIQAAGRSYFQVLNVVYLPLISATFGVFDCVQVGSTGTYVMANAASQLCYTHFYWATVFPLAVVFSIAYGLGIPLALGGMLWRARRQHDEIMFHLKYAFLVARYRSGMKLFEVAVLVRKLLVVIALVLFGNGRHEALLVVVVLAATAMHVSRAVPYVRSSHNNLDTGALLATMCVIIGALAEQGSAMGELAMTGGLIAILVAIVASVVYDVATMRKRRNDEFAEGLESADHEAVTTKVESEFEMASFGSTSVCVYEVGADSITAGGTATVGMPGGSIGPQASTAVVGPDTSLHSATLQSATFDSFYQ
ncbi:P-selectin [Thecamonas trahens ATCC 50062]|uniref:p-selectin n=1 Tax=Thecamonas trahens ATCC 50062 TaxID=461836 RepID=A0A0L0DJ03_THETB|nr:P-selectin [Thecamonas trahens ATCC 50062]KNC51308.1 P-selectin [Thecamonas trahens ATCC 50062]|eukprot:XP_013756230.1 P-selectin [Thecamonas trahens ATCC 50062]